MVKCKGGRSLKAEHPTKVRRIQERLEPIISKIEYLLDSGLTEQELLARLDNSNNAKLQLPDKQETIDLINKTKKSKKNLTPVLENLLQVIYADSNVKLLQVFIIAMTTSVLATIELPKLLVYLA